MLGDLAHAKFIQPAKDPRLEALQEHAVCTLDLPVRSGVRDGGPIDPDVVFIAESKELLAGELCATVRNDGVRYSKAMDDVEEE